MPITGKFVADFASFQDAVQKATVSLKGMETQGNTVSTSLNKMVDQFSGRKIIQDAELMSQAFQQLAEKGIGLTNRELTRMGDVANEAIAKLRAGGEQVPPGMQRIADAAAKIKSPLDQASTSGMNLFTNLKNVAGVLGIAFSVGAIKNFVGGVFDAASTIGDMADKLGISAEAAQRFKFAAEQSGATIEDIDSAIGKMNKNLAEGSKSTVGALKDAGLEFHNIRSMKPEDAFAAIGEAIKGIQDPMEQARIVTELWGKSALQLLPAVKAGLKDVGAQTSVMSDDTVKQLKDAQDAWTALGNKVTVVTGGMIASIGNFISGLSPLMVGTFSKAAKAVETDFDRAFNKKFAEQQAALAQGAHKTQEELAAAAVAAKKYADALDAAAVAGGKAFVDHQKHLKAIADQTADVNLQMGILVKDRLEALGTRGQVILKAMTDESVKFGLAMSGNLPVVEGLGRNMEILGQKSVTGITPVMPLLNTFKLDLKDLSQALSQLALVAGGSFGSIASGLATLVSAANTAKTSIANIKEASKAGFSLDGILGMTTGISGLVSAGFAAFNILKKLFSLGGPSEEELAGRQAVADFHAELEAMLTVAQRAEAGNEAWKIDVIAIRDAYLAAGKTMEEAEAATKKLWESSKGGSESAKRAIEEIQKVIGKNTDATEDATAATEEQAQATIETATQAAKALDELGPRLKTNEADWHSWGDVVTGEIARIAAAVRAMAIPTGAGVPSGSSGSGGFQSSEDARRQGGHANITVNTVVNGRTIATANAEAALGWS